LRLILALLFIITPFLDAQSGNPDSEQHFSRRIVWTGGEHALRYAVEIDKLENGNYQNHSRGFTTSLYFDVSLPLGEFRFRIVPHDILDRPAEGTPWMHFEVRPAPRPDANQTANVSPENPAIAGASNNESEQFQIISIDDYDSTGVLKPEPEAEGREETNKESESERKSVITEKNAKFNTVGVSVGSSIIDPLVIATAHGTFAPMRNLFMELGCDFGFISIYEDVERFFCIYPFAHLGLFMPFKNKGGFFTGAGGGYMTGNYTFSYGEAEINTWGVNVIAGINLWNVINISYTLKTNFEAMSHKIAVGYVYRFYKTVHRSN